MQFTSMTRMLGLVAVFVTAWLNAGLAMAADTVFGQPHPWQLNFQAAAGPLAARIDSFHTMLLVIITVITLFVLALLIYVMVRFRASANPVPSKNSHNTLVEVIWTVAPILILVTISIPSFKLLYYEDHNPEAEMTIKVIGHQWYWSYEYPDHGGFTFDASMVATEDLKPGQPRLLETDNHVVVPVNTTVRVLSTADDVIHAWTVPSLGLKRDATPGRVNESWFRAEREGTFYGQCSELCGVNHGFMPISVDVVSKEAFAKWVVEAKTKFASNGPSTSDTPRLADAGNSIR